MNFIVAPSGGSGRLLIQEAAQRLLMLFDGAPVALALLIGLRRLEQLLIMTDDLGMAVADEAMEVKRGLTPESKSAPASLR